MDQLRHWNQWYDSLPELWRFPTVVAVLVLVGAINMALTIASGFPFGLLVLIAVAVLGAVRIPYLIGASEAAPDHPAAAATDQPAMPDHADWLHQWNHWYDGFPELWRFQIVVWGLVVIGALNMALTIGGGFPFGLLVLLAVIAICAIRLPYVMGWGHRTAAAAPAPDPALAGPETPALAAPQAAPPPTSGLGGNVERLEPAPAAPARPVPLYPTNGGPDHHGPDHRGPDHQGAERAAAREPDDVPPPPLDQFSPESPPPAA